MCYLSWQVNFILNNTNLNQDKKYYNIRLSELQTISISPQMKITNFFKRLNTTKHKYKLQFAIDILSISASVSQQITIMIKRGSNKQSTNPGKLRKGKLDFKKQRLIFQEVTMFYDQNSGQYLSKDCQIKVLIHGEGGQRKLAGFVELDLSEYLNDKLQFKREERELEKCPDKHKAKISYEVYMKFLRESNSETAGSVIGELKPRKREEGKKEEEGKKKGEVKSKRELLLNDDIFEEEQNGEKEQKSKKGKKDVKEKGNQVTVHFDKELEEKNKNKNKKGSFEDEFSEEQVEQPVIPKQPKYQQVVDFEEAVSMQTPNKPKSTYSQHIDQDWNEKQDIQQQQYDDLDLPSLQHQDTEHYTQLFKSLQKQTNRLSLQNSQLQLKAMGLKQKASEAQKLRQAQIEEVSRDTTYDNVGKYQLRIKQLQRKLEQSRQSRKQNQKAYQQLLTKYEQVKVSLDTQRVGASMDLEAVEAEYKKQIDKKKEQIKAVKASVEKLQKQYKNASKEMVELRREEEARQAEKVEAETKITEIELAVNLLKTRVADAMNVAGFEGDDELMDFLIEQFRS